MMPSEQFVIGFSASQTSDVHPLPFLAQSVPQ
jgi:hypothetical protein